MSRRQWHMRISYGRVSLTYRDWKEALHAVASTTSVHSCGGSLVPRFVRKLANSHEDSGASYARSGYAWQSAAVLSRSHVALSGCQ